MVGLKATFLISVLHFGSSVVAEKVVGKTWVGCGVQKKVKKSGRHAILSYSIQLLQLLSLYMGISAFLDY